MPTRLMLAAAITLAVTSTVADPTDRRVVDTAVAGDAASEAMHGYVGHESVADTTGGRPTRRATGWMRYALHVFDDTPVTVVLVFAADSIARHYDVVVEDSLVASRSLAADDPANGAAVTVEVDVPFAVTRGRPDVAVVIRARDGVTPALRELRTVQDHNEL